MKSLFWFVSFTAFAASPTTEIKVGQAGYLPVAAKIALVAAKVEAKEFFVRESPGGAIAFRGVLSASADDPDSGDRVQAADFTVVKKSGAYYLDVPGVGRSWEFRVAGDVYARPYYLALRSFYGQRCGTKVDLGPEFPGYKYEACHLTGAWHASSGKTGARESVKGWHDAGDYGRSIYMIAGDEYNQYSGWEQMGIFTVGNYPQPPTNISVTPPSGTALATTFTFTYGEPTGAQNLSYVAADIGSSLNGVGSCLFFILMTPRVPAYLVRR